jgi:L-asparaginase
MEILFINSGGTFNKRYNSISGELEVPSDSLALRRVLKSVGDNIEYRIVGAVYKDSLDFEESDREEIRDIILESTERYIVVIHGTDTINITAKYLEKYVKNKVVILTGAMRPVAIEGNDGAINLGVAIGFLNSGCKNGIYISMSGLCLEHSEIYKSRDKGIFHKR